MTEVAIVAVAIAAISVAVATYLVLFFFRAARCWSARARHWQGSSKLWEDTCKDILRSYEEATTEVGRLKAREMASRAKAIRGSEGWWRN